MQKNMIQKKLIIFLVVLVIILAGTIMFFASTTDKKEVPIFEKVEQVKSSPETQPQTEPNNHETKSTNKITSWKIFSNEEYGFEFMYPQTLSPETIDSYGVLVHLKSNDGEITVRIEDKKLDPKNIGNIYGKVEEEDLKTLDINGNKFYLYRTVDAGCFVDVANLALGEKTLKFVFFACEEQKGLAQYMNEILTTFKFIK